MPAKARTAIRLAPMELARELETAIADLRATASRLASGPFRRTRARLLKQLDKLDGVLGEVQRLLLAQGGETPLMPTVRDELSLLHDRLATVADTPPTKELLKDARRAVKRARLLIAAHLDELQGRAA